MLKAKWRIESKKAEARMKASVHVESKVAH
jgi:hypothetical protein